MSTIRQIPAGNNVLIRFKVRDLKKEPPELFDPDEWVKVTLWDAAGAAVVTDAAMLKEATPRVGVYVYEYQTASNQAKGKWQVQVKTRHSGRENRTLKLVAFELVTA